MTEENLIGGKLTSRFYRLPFKEGSRILTQETLEAHTKFRIYKSPYWGTSIKSVSFKNYIMTKILKVEQEPLVQIYFKVEHDYLLISCSVDTDDTYLSWYVYRALRVMMWNGEYDFQAYYWPACFDEETGRSKFLKIFNDRCGFDIELKDGFKGLFRPDDPFPLVDGRKVLERIPVKSTTNTLNCLGKGIGYCLADTSLRSYHSNHYPFLIPYVFTVNANLKTVKTFEHFVFNEADIGDLTLSHEQVELNEVCFEMKRVALLSTRAYGDTPEREQEITATNAANKKKIHQLWNRVWPLLVAQGFTHYWFTYGMRNVQKKPMKKLMEPVSFSDEVPRLSFLLTDKGDYYELFLRFKIKGKLLHFREHGQALPMVCSKGQTLWYLLEAEMDGDMVMFFSEFKFKIQIPKTYYAEYFEKHLKALEKFYEVMVK